MQLVLYRGDYPSEILLKKLIKAAPNVQESEGTFSGDDASNQDLDNDDRPAPAPVPPVAMLVFSSSLTKKALEKAGKVAQDLNVTVYDAGQIPEVLDREKEVGIELFAKDPLLCLGWQIIIAGGLCKELAIHDLFVPSYREDENPIPKIAVVVKFARKVLLNALGSAVDVITPFSELTEQEIKEGAKTDV